MSASASTTRRRALLLLLAAPLVLIPIGAYVVASDASRGSSLPVAQGASGGAFHPIAGGFVADEREVDECDGDTACLEQAFGNLAYRSGPEAALALFEDRLASDPVVEQGCHRISHFIGSASLERFRGNVARTFSLGSPLCVSGYYHGILERAFLGVSSKAELQRKATYLCVTDGMRRRGFLDYQCRHGLGHGLMIQTGYDLPMALDICAKLGTGWDRKACAGGAFMENINTAFGYRSSWLDDSDPLYPCARVEAEDRRSCYLRASWRLLVVEKGSYERTVAACVRLGKWASTCVQGFGRDVAEKARYEADGIVRLCGLVTASRRGDCILGAARTIANASGAAGIEPATRLCARVDARYRPACFSGVGLVLGMLQPTTEARRNACRRVTSYVHACLAAAEAEVDPSGARAWG